MNNSRLAAERVSLSLDEQSNTKTLRDREAEITRFIEAAEIIFKSEEWSTLKRIKFDRHLESLERQLRIESEKSEINTSIIYRLQGEIKWARKYVDLEKFTHAEKDELIKIRNIIKSNE